MEAAKVGWALATGCTQKARKLRYKNIQKTGNSKRSNVKDQSVRDLDSRRGPQLLQGSLLWLRNLEQAVTVCGMLSGDIAAFSQ